MKLKLSLFCVSLICLSGLTVRAQVTLNPRPSREVGHPAAAFNPISPSPSTLNPNLVEGREFDTPEGIAIDNSVSPPIVYVADYGNSRVLGWNYTPTLGVPSAGPFPPADYVIGQSDRYSTLAQNAQGNANGLAYPSGLAVDSNGNLYVVDSGNNRILRFPRGSTSPDLVIGQLSVNSNLANQGQSVPSAYTIALNGAIASILFDKNGNLFFTDTLNNRVLRYDVSTLTAGNNGPSATLVLGQNSFNSNTAQSSAFDSGGVPILNGLSRPTTIAMDSLGRLYVGDGLGRVLAYPASLFNGAPATAVAGFVLSTATQQVKNNTVLASVGSVFVTSDNRVGVVDGTFCRILMLPTVDTWPAPTSKTALSPQAATVLPQGNLDISSVQYSHYINAGNAEASAGTFSLPSFAMVNPGNGGELFLADSGNHRVLVIPLPLTNASSARAVFGQDQFNYMTVNLVEGREFQFTLPVSGGTLADGDVVIDTNSNPPHLYVADTYNNRILGFADARTVKPGAKADLVIGQPDMNRTVCNYNPNSRVTSTSPNAGSLCQPVGLALDPVGNLWVTDRGNYRVLRFPTPFAQAATLQQADTVIGQGAQNNFIGNARSPQNFGGPYGIALDPTGSPLIVSDPAFNRVLVYENRNGAWARTKVLGQTDPNTCPAGGCPSGSALNQLRGPQHMAIDSGGILYVSDSGNNRVLIYGNPATLANGDFAQGYSLVTGLSNPNGLFVNQATGEIWVADSNSGRVLRYPRLDNIVQGNNQPTAMQEATGTIALAQDQFGDLYVADASNRIVIHYPGLLAVNGANYLLQFGTANPYPLAPGIEAAICPPLGSTGKACLQDNPNPNYFGTNTATYTDLPNPLPLPTVLADTQVNINGVPAPLFYVSPQQINFQVPQATPTGPTPVLVEVVRPSTGQTLGSYPVQISQYSPGLMYNNVHTQILSTGSDPCRGPNGICYQAVANNSDGTSNSPSSPALHGTTIQLFGTGLGPVQNAPPDGQPAADQAPVSATPRVFIGGTEVTSNVSYVGLTAGQIGIWEIDLKIPDTLQSIGTTGYTNYIVLVLTPDGRSTNDANQMNPTIAVK
jgi:uncharacterized protein (TIGR03437 family)